MKPTSIRYFAAAAFTCLLVIAGMAAVWAGFGLFWRKPCGWLALVAAVDAALLLRLAGFGPGAARARIALVATTLAILAGGFVAAAVSIGVGFGSLPHEAIWRIGPELAGLWWRLNINLWDALTLLLALPLAWFMGR